MIYIDVIIYIKNKKKEKNGVFSALKNFFLSWQAFERLDLIGLTPLFLLNAIKWDLFSNVWV
jgi:hypothetical protein